MPFFRIPEGTCKMMRMRVLNFLSAFELRKVEQQRYGSRNDNLYVDKIVNMQ